MEDSINNFNLQFDWKPEVKNPRSAWVDEPIVICGMGGSHLGGGLIKLSDPELPIFEHRDYGLPDYPSVASSFLIASSYSGNTEETIDFLNRAVESGLKPSVVASGGGLLELAYEHGLPYVSIPATGIQPRMAVGYSMLAILALLGMEAPLKNLATYSKKIHPSLFRQPGEVLAKALSGKLAIIYTSTKNKEISYNWKIKLNETGKTFAFANVFPELNHNEMMGYTKHAGKPNIPMAAIFIDDPDDHDRVQKRMQITKDILREQDIEVLEVPASGNVPLEKAFNSLLLADWTAYHLAKSNGVDPEAVPLVEEFKKRMKE